MSSIGLKRGTVKLMPHKKEWHILFMREKIILQKVLSNNVQNIQHKGSTAVPGLYAKPIIDIAIGVRSLTAFKREIPKLRRIGYWWKKNYPDSRRHLFLAKGPDRSRRFYLHVVRHGGSLWQADMRFLNAMRKSSLLRRQYNILKKRLAKQYPDNRGSYTAGKQPFILSVIKKRS